MNAGVNGIPNGYKNYAMYFIPQFVTGNDNLVPEAMTLITKIREINLKGRKKKGAS